MCILTGNHVAKPQSELHLKIYQRCTASSFLLPLCTKYVFHCSCYLPTQNPSPLPSPLLSSHLLSHLSTPSCCHTTLTCVCALVPSFPWHLTMAVSGFPFFFALPLFPLSLKTKKKSCCVQDMPSILRQAHNMGLSLGLY